jgi:hypothetical protein
LRVFVAYGGPEAEAIAKRVHTFLQENKVEAYVAPNDNPAGEWDPRVQGALKRADVFLVVCCPNSLKRRDLFKEVILATEWNLTFETFLDGRVDKYNTRFPRKMRDSDIVTFERRNPDAKFKEVLDKIEGVAGDVLYRRVEPEEPVKVR